MATISGARTGDAISATWTAEPKYAYIWASCVAPGYEKWVAVRSESWSDGLLEWAGVPPAATLALMSPTMRGERRVWRTLATCAVP